jgi:polyhydroxyalkanoate synthase
MQENEVSGMGGEQFDWQALMGAQLGGMTPPKLDTAQLMAWQQQYLQAMLAGPKAAAQDRRFAHKAWQGGDLHAQMAAWYVLHNEHLNGLRQILAGSGHQGEQAAFMMEQWLAAMAPSNYLPFNPEALELAKQTNGASLQQGLANLLADLQQGRISQTDESVFEVGKNVATTPGDVVFENDFIQLIQYRPTTPKVHALPFLLVPPCINKYYILDLQPENSLVKYVVDQGHTVFLVSWRNPLPGEGMEHATWDDYLNEGPVDAINAVRAITGAEQINALGFCVGGTLLASALAALAAKKQRPVASLTLLTTLLDFTEPGILGVFVDEAQVAMREAQFANGGLMPARDLNSAFSALRPNDLVWNYVVGNYLKGERPPAFDLLYWNSDSTNLSGPMFAQYLRRLYIDNALARGELHSLGVRLDLSSIDVPTYVYSSREDHIVPWGSAYASAQALQARDLRFVLGASGHIAGVINPASKNKRNFWVGRAGKLPATADTWFDAATEKPGSWWPDWAAWLSKHGGGMKPAPKKAGSAKFPAIEPAPGRYVKVRAI